MKSGTDIHGSQKMNPNDSGEPLTHVMPPAGQILFNYPIQPLHLQGGLAHILVQCFPTMNSYNFTDPLTLTQAHSWFLFI